MDTRNEAVKLIAEALVEVERLSHVPEQIATTKDKIDLYLLRAIESRIAFDVLLNLLKVSSQNTSVFSQDEILAQFRSIYEIRWRLIANTDCAYSVAPSLPINQAWLLVAEKLAPLEGKHAYNWLMPSIDFSTAITMGCRSCYEYKLHEFLIGSGNIPLGIDACFEYLEGRAGLLQRRKSSTKLLPHPPQTQEVKSSLKSLPMQDECMVAEHSFFAKEYYDAILSNFNIIETRERFKQSMQAENVEVLASYGEQGRISLMKSLLANVHSLLGMSDFLFKHVPKVYWKYFITSLSQDDLFNIVLRINLNKLRAEYRNEDYGAALCAQTDTILRKLTDAHFTFAHEDELRALMLCLLQVYRISRKEGPEFKSTLGCYVGSFFSWAHPKDNRIQACDALLNFLLSDPPHPLADLIGYLTKNEFHEHIDTLTVGAYLDYNNTTLYKLTKLMLDTAAQFAKSHEHDNSAGVYKLSTH